MQKTEHVQFLRMLDARLLELGAEKFVYSKGFEGRAGAVPEVPGYRFQTTYGPVVLHPEIPWPLNKGDRLRYSATVFGRFEGSGPYPPAANPYSGKWNFCLGPCSVAQLPDCIGHISARVSALLPGDGPRTAI